MKKTEVPCIIADDLTPAQIKAFRLADNKVAEASQWDMELLALEMEDIDMDMTLFGFDDEEEDKSYIDKFREQIKSRAGDLTARFIVPPLTILDARQGYWRNRKKDWLAITGDLSETRDGEFGTLGNSDMINSYNGGTSNFDPVLAEIMFRWFCPAGGKILDPFGGEQTKGVVAGHLGFSYTSVEIRQEQVDLNTEKTSQYERVKYVCGDSNNISKLIKERDFDMCFTSPPYYDLEVYSEGDMSALGTYEEFMTQYENIFRQCYNMLKDNSFLVIKVGEIRDKKTGIYRGFVPDNIDIFKRVGFKYYNEAILITTYGTVPLRATKSMATRKLGKTHQNILVFYKGNEKEIPKKFEKLDFSGVEELIEQENGDEDDTQEWEEGNDNE